MKKLQEHTITGLFGAWITSFVAGVGISPMLLQKQVDLLPPFLFCLAVWLVSTSMLLVMVYVWDAGSKE